MNRGVFTELRETGSAAHAGLSLHAFLRLEIGGVVLHQIIFLRHTNLSHQHWGISHCEKRGFCGESEDGLWAVVCLSQLVPACKS